MKLPYLIVALTLAVTGAAFAAEDHAHAVKPQQGGVVVMVKDIEHELVAKPDGLQLYLRDHGKPVDVSQSRAKLTLLSTGFYDVTLTFDPASSDCATQ